MIGKAELNGTAGLFPLLVKLNVFHENENIDLLRFDVAIEFSDEIQNRADNLAATCQSYPTNEKRTDLTSLSLMTIDGQSTLDFDDALSIETVGDQFRLGIHIVDVGHFVGRDFSR